MPKVSSLTLKIDGAKYDYAVYYGKTSGFHIKPDETTRTVANISGMSSIREFDTEHELGKYWQEAVDKYHDLTKSTRKVIAVQFALGDEVKYNRTRLANGGRSGSLRPELQNFELDAHNGSVSAYGMSFDYCMYEILSGATEKYVSIDKDGYKSQYPSTSKPKGMIMDWTQEREQSCASLCEAITKLGLHMANVLFDGEKLQALLDSNSSVKLLQ